MAGVATPVELGAILEALSKPATYPHPVERLHVLQTHSSCVALTGELVYKVKKPVNFGFLDYSTAEKRRALCEAEVRLNRRLCPDVYLDVVPLTTGSGQLRFCGAGPPVDWAVRMRQLPEADMLPARLAAGTVSAEHIERIAVTLARFHARTPDLPLDGFGSPEAVAFNVRENLAGLALLVGTELPRAHLDAIRDHSERFLIDRRDLFRERVRAGWVRDGHGDLRAQNICLFEDLQGGVQIFDCIEFNNRFRYGDVACDLAYLAMDLDLAGHRDLREVLVSTYEQASGDSGLRSVLPIYLCYRASVRGKIALLAASETEIPPAEREQHRDLAAAAFDLALSYAEERSRPRLWITVGYSGSGKSALAREMARRAPAVVLSSDRVRKELAGVPPAAQLSLASYQAGPVAGVYAELRRRAKPLLVLGMDVILDATFLSRDERREASWLAANTDADFRILECVCPDPEIRRRLRARAAGDHASDAGTDVYEGQIARWEDLASTESATCARTDQPPTKSAREVLHSVHRGAGPHRPDASEAE